MEKEIPKVVESVESIEIIYRSIISPTNKYCIDVCKDDSEIQKTTTFSNCQGVRTVKSDKYLLIKIRRMDDNYVIFQYRQFSGHSLGHIFFTQNGIEWCLGSREYMSQLFINCYTGEYYDNCKVNFLDDSGYVKLNNGIEYPNNGWGREGFIWSGVEILFDGHIALVDGCFWGNSNEYKIFDLKDIKNGWSEVEFGDELFDFNGYDYQMKYEDGELRFYRDFYVENEIIAENVMAKAYTYINGEFVDLHKADELLDEINKKQERLIKDKHDQVIRDNINLFCSSNNIFKDWLNQKEIEFCEVSNNNENAIKLLEIKQEDIVKISCSKTHPQQNHNSHIPNFLKLISVDNVMVQLEEGFEYFEIDSGDNFDKITHSLRFKEFCIKGPENKIYNRLLSEQIGLIACCRLDKIPKNYWNDIDLIFTFECKDFSITFSVEVFLSDDDSCINTRKFDKNSLVKITIT
jgi:hypothetical protein